MGLPATASAHPSLHTPQVAEYDLTPEVTTPEAQAAGAAAVAFYLSAQVG